MQLNDYHFNCYFHYKKKKVIYLVIKFIQSPSQPKKDQINMHHLNGNILQIESYSHIFILSQSQSLRVLQFHSLIVSYIYSDQINKQYKLHDYQKISCTNKLYQANKSIKRSFLSNQNPKITVISQILKSEDFIKKVKIPNSQVQQNTNLISAQIFRGYQFIFNIH
ncbi:hypothetical protein pb186bvf_007401, partial [Paramecium bursaria]